MRLRVRGGAECRVGRPDVVVVPAPALRVQDGDDRPHDPFPDGAARPFEEVLQAPARYPVLHAPLRRGGDQAPDGPDRPFPVRPHLPVLGAGVPAGSHLVVRVVVQVRRRLALDEGVETEGPAVVPPATRPGANVTSKDGAAGIAAETKGGGGHVIGSC